MSRQAKLAAVLMSAVVALSLVGATWAWFISLNTSPGGTATSALVRYLPERVGDTESILAYGNLAGGGSTDQEGVPHVLPGDSLLASSETEDGLRRVRTTLARSYQDGETEGSVITSEKRTYGAGSVTRVQRDVKITATPVESWIPSKPERLDQSYYNITITNETSRWEITEDDVPATVTQTLTSTTYEPKDPADLGHPRYVQTLTHTVTVRHESAAYTGGSESDYILAGSAAMTEQRVETVLYTNGRNPDGTVPTVTGEKITRSQVYIARKESGPSGSIPLSVGNLSTIPTQLRLGVSAILGRKGVYTPLTMRKDASGRYHFGMNDDDGNFIELLDLTPAEGWIPAASGTGLWDANPNSAWNLWDYAPGGNSVIPAAALAEGSDTERTVTVIPSVKELKVASSSHTGVAQDIFESSFNSLYCTESPDILLHVRFYAKQAEYMEWSEFLSQSITIQMTTE